MIRNELITRADQLLDEVWKNILQRQNERYDEGLSPKRDYPVSFKDLPFGTVLPEKVANTVHELIKAGIAEDLYKERFKYILLIAALSMVRYEPYDGGFWQVFFSRYNLSPFTQHQLRERMWKAFTELGNKNWFRLPVISLEKRRLLVHSIYREAKAIGFSQIKDFFIRYYSAYDDMRAFDEEYDQWKSHPFGNETEKDRNRVLVRETVERLFSIFNVVEDESLAILDLSKDQIIDAIREQTGLNPLTMFKDSEGLIDLILRIFQNVVTLNQFERYLREQKPSDIIPTWRDKVKWHWDKLIENGVPYGSYLIGNKTFEVVPKAGLSLKEMVDWPMNRFFDPVDPDLKAEEIEADTVALRKSGFFKVTKGIWMEEEAARAFYYAGTHQGYVWVGKRRIGQEFFCEKLKCPSRQGAKFSWSLKYDPRNHSLKIVFGYVDFFDPNKRYAVIKIILNQDEMVWEANTDSCGRRNREIQEAFTISPERVPGEIEGRLEVDDKTVAGPEIISVKEHMLFSRYTNTSISPGRTKFGETRFQLLTVLDESKIEVDDSVKLTNTHKSYGKFRIYDVKWRELNSTFQLRTGDIEWTFQIPRDLYFIPEFQYEDEFFEISPELVNHATKKPESLSIRLHTNLLPKQLEQYDFAFLKDEKTLSSGVLSRLLDVSEKVSENTYRITEKSLKALQDNRPIIPGSYKLKIQKGRPGNRKYFLQEMHFSILPEIVLLPGPNVYLEGEPVRVEVKADSPCFWDNTQNKRVDSCSIDIGPSHLADMGKHRCKIQLNNPGVSLHFSIQPNVFTCRLNSRPIDSVIESDSIENNNFKVYGPPGKIFLMITPYGFKKIHLGSEGIAILDQSFFKNGVERSCTEIKLRLDEKEIVFDLWRLPKIAKFEYPDDDVLNGRILFNEASYKIEIDGPPDGQILLRLFNNLGEVCGESIVEGSGFHKGSVKWAEEVTVTKAAVLKVFIRTPDKKLIPDPKGELHYEYFSPERELAIYLDKAERQPENAENWFYAATIAHEYNLREPSEIINWLDKAIENGLSFISQLDHATGIYMALGEIDKAEKTIFTILGAQKLSVSACRRYLDIACAKNFWGKNTDNIFRHMIGKASRCGMKKDELLIYQGCRSLKKGRFEEAVDQFYTAQEIYPEKSEDIGNLILIAFLKLGWFWEIEKHEPKNNNTLYTWAMWVSDSEKSDLHIWEAPLPEKILIFLTNYEKAILILGKEFYRKNPAKIISELNGYPDCPAILLTRRAFFRDIKDYDAANAIYRKLISLNSRFERELKIYGK